MKNEKLFKNLLHIAVILIIWSAAMIGVIVRARKGGNI